MSAGSFKLSGLDVDLEMLESEVERRSGGAADDLPRRAPPPETPGRGPGGGDGDASPLQILLRSLAEDSDVAQGFPPQSHRTLGGAVVAAKRGLRLAMQPLINEAFAKQKAFNRRLLDLLAALLAENQKLEARVRQLENRGRDSN